MVKVFTDTAELLHHRSQLKEKVGFVPTMGNLHAGHISLLEAALGDFQTVYFSIFVNPKQFGPHEDFNRYPRTLDGDIRLIEGLMPKFPNALVYVYAPKDPAEVFPEKSDTAISSGELGRILEGAVRPGHFDGVTTVVHRLFELVRPSKAYFGLKDYQQYVVIKQMVENLGLPVEIRGLPIIREATGLALSSRNQYLTPDEKERALVLPRTLLEISASLDGKRANISRALRKITEAMEDKNWNYLEFRDAVTLSSDISESSRLALLAVYQLGTTRLLDNAQMEIK